MFPCGNVKASVCTQTADCVTAFDLVLMGHLPGHGWPSKTDLSLNSLIPFLHPQSFQSLVVLEALRVCFWISLSLCLLPFLLQSLFLLALLLLLLLPSPAIGVSLWIARLGRSLSVFMAQMCYLRPRRGEGSRLVLECGHSGTQWALVLLSSAFLHYHVLTTIPRLSDISMGLMAGPKTSQLCDFQQVTSPEESDHLQESDRLWLSASFKIYH